MPELHKRGIKQCEIVQLLKATKKKNGFINNQNI